MAREEVKPPRELADEHTLIAQRYAGALVGHPYRVKQQGTEVTVDRRRPWKELAVVADDCIFCVRLTDEEAVRRVAGFQCAIDVEAIRTKGMHYMGWLSSGSPDVIDPGEGLSHTHETNQANRRRFCELFQDMPTEKRPDGWRMRPFPLVALPLRLKRKMCVEWNHLYIRWMEEEGLQYDFAERVFWHEVETQAEATMRMCTACAAELGPDADHADGCAGARQPAIYTNYPLADPAAWTDYGGAAPDQDCHS